MGKFKIGTVGWVILHLIAIGLVLLAGHYIKF